MGWSIGRGCEASTGSSSETSASRGGAIIGAPMRPAFTASRPRVAWRSFQSVPLVGWFGGQLGATHRAPTAAAAALPASSPALCSLEKSSSAATTIAALGAFSRANLATAMSWPLSMAHKTVQPVAAWMLKPVE